MIGSIVGSRLFAPVASALVVILIFWGLIQYGQNTERNSQEADRLRDQIETRDRIDEAIRNTPDDTDGARGVLTDFIQSRD